MTDLRAVVAAVVCSLGVSAGCGSSTESTPAGINETLDCPRGADLDIGDLTGTPEENAAEAAAAGCEYHTRPGDP